MEFKNYIADSRIWVFQANRKLDENEKTWLQEQIDLFTETWASHGSQLKASGSIISDFALVLAVDASHLNSSGCSIDKSVHFMKTVGKELNVDFFDRLKVWIKTADEELIRIPFKDLKLYPTSTYFDGTVQNLAEFNSKYEMKVSEFTDIV